MNVQSAGLLINVNVTQSVKKWYVKVTFCSELQTCRVHLFLNLNYLSFSCVGTPWNSLKDHVFFSCCTKSYLLSLFQWNGNLYYKVNVSQSGRDGLIFVSKALFVIIACLCSCAKNVPLCAPGAQETGSYSLAKHRPLALA